MSGAGMRGIATFLLVNLLIIRFLRPIVSALTFVSFRLWIDWLLLGAVLIRGKWVRLVGLDGLVVLTLAAIVIVQNLADHGIGSSGLEEALSIPLVLGLPLFYAMLARNQHRPTWIRYLKRTLVLLNIYFYVNAVIIIGQVAGVIPIAPQFIAENPSLIDHMTGLVGLNGVSTLNFIWIATIAGNVRFIRDSKWRLVAVVTQLALAGWLSVLNDNKMFVVTAGLSAALMLAINLRTIRRWIPILLLGAACVFPFLVDLFESLGRTESGVSLDLASILLYDPNLLPNPNNERAYINFLAYHWYNGFGNGVGLGVANAESKEIHIHLGINSASLLLIQGGIPLLVVTTMILFVGLRAIVGRRGTMAALMLAVFTVMLVYISNPIADRYTLTAVCIFMAFVSANPPDPQPQLATQANKSQSTPAASRTNSEKASQTVHLK